MNGTTVVSTSQYTARDPMGRVKEETWHGGQTVGFDYDALGAVTQVTPPSRPSHVMSYDDAPGLLTKYDPPSVTGLTTKSTAYTWDKDQRPTGMTRPDNKSATKLFDAVTGRSAALNTSDGNVSVAYDSSGRVESLTTSTGAKTQYTYDGSMVTSMTTTADGVAHKVGFQRDGLQRLVQQSVTGAPDVTFDEYDKDGMVKRVTVGTSQLNLAYNSVPFTYNANGELIGRGGDTFTYDTFGNTERACQPQQLQSMPNSSDVP